MRLSDRRLSDYQTGLIAYLRKNGQNPSGKISEEQADYFVDSDETLTDLEDDLFDDAN